MAEDDRQRTQPPRAPKPAAARAPGLAMDAGIGRMAALGRAPLTPAAVLGLQRTIGNRAVGRMLLQRTIQDDVANLRQDLAETEDPLLQDILNEILTAYAMPSVATRYGHSNYQSEANVDRDDNENRNYDVVIDDQQVPDATHRQSYIVHELMHVAVDQKYAFNRNRHEESLNVIEDPTARNAHLAARPQIELLRKLATNLIEVVEGDRAVLGDATTDHLKARAGRTTGSTAQEFDTVMSELYYYVSKVGIPRDSKTFKEIRALAKAAYTSRNLQREIGDTYAAPGSFREFARESACFITTACCQARGLPDDCEELTVLRAFRDGWMAAQRDGPEMIGLYYRIAPRVVAAVQARDDAAAVWDGFYSTVRQCVGLIREGRNEQAMHVYRDTVLRLRDEVCPDVGGSDDGDGEEDEASAAMGGGGRDAQRSAGRERLRTAG